MSKSKFDTSKESGIHFRFHALVGTWTGTTKTWFAPGDPEDESPNSGTIKAILDGRFLLHEYHSAFKGTATEGMSLIGFDLANNKFQVAWVDSFHMSTGILFSQGPDQGKLVSAVGSYGDPSMTERWGWRTEIEMPSEDVLIITAYNIEPGAEPQQATETVYKRVRIAI